MIFFGKCLQRSWKNEENHGNDDDDGCHEGDDDHTAGSRLTVSFGRQGVDNQQDSAGPVADHHAQKALVQVWRRRRRAHYARVPLFRVAVGWKFRRPWRLGQEVFVVVVAVVGGCCCCKSGVGLQVIQAIIIKR